MKTDTEVWRSEALKEASEERLVKYSKIEQSTATGSDEHSEIAR